MLSRFGSLFDVPPLALEWTFPANRLRSDTMTDKHYFDKMLVKLSTCSKMDCCRAQFVHFACHCQIFQAVMFFLGV